MSGPTPSNYDYSQYTQDAETTAHESYRIKDGAGGTGVFIPEMIQDVKRFQPSIGEKVIDIIMAPCGSKHPLVVKGKLQQGQMTYITWTFIHKGVGNDWWVCLARTFNQPCPICEYRNRLKADPDVPDDTVKMYGSGKFATGIYKIIHHSNPQSLTWQEPVMVWDINYSFMESTLQSMAKQPMASEDAPTGYINYMWPTAGAQGGRHIKFEVKAKGQYFDYDGHLFIKRQNPVPPHIMEAAKAMPPLDEMVRIPSYTEMKDALEVSLNQPIGGEPTGETYGETYGGIGGMTPGYEETSFGTPAGANPVPFGTPEDKCPFAEYEGILGVTFDNWTECGSCALRAKCQEMFQAAQKPAPAPPTAKVPPTAKAPAPTMSGTTPPTMAPLARPPRPNKA